MDSGGGNTGSSDPTKTSTAEASTNSLPGCGCSTANNITIRVTPTTGGQFDLQVQKTESVENFKKLISKKLKVPKERICLLHRDRQLRDGTLQENQLVDGSRLTLLPSVETGLLAQRPEQSVMQALESLNDAQVNDFLSGKAPLNLTMRLGDHMMLIQLQLSTVTPSASRRSTGATATTTTTSSSSSSSSSTSTTTSAPSSSASSTSSSSAPSSPTPSTASSTSTAPASPASPCPAPAASPASPAPKPSPAVAASLPCLSSVMASSSPPPPAAAAATPAETAKAAAEDAASLLTRALAAAAAEAMAPPPAAPPPAPQPPPAASTPTPASAPAPAAAHACSGGASGCRCEGAAARPTLDTRALAEASRNLTQTLKQLSSEVLTSRSDAADDSSRNGRRQGAIIESMHHHGKGVYSGTFSGTLNPALQDRFGRPKRDISTIIHILNDLLCATPQYRRHTRQGHSLSVEATRSSAQKKGTNSSDKSASSLEFMDDSGSLSRENQATRGKMEHLRLIMEERRARRRARREARAAPYTTQWSAKSESLPQSSPMGHNSVEPMETSEQPATSSSSDQQLCELNPPEPVVA